MLDTAPRTPYEACVLSHVELNVSDLVASAKFYLAALGPMGFVQADSKEGEYVRLTNGRDTVIILGVVGAKYRHLPYHRKAVGLGHIALSVPQRGDVDAMADHLSSLGVALLGDGKVETGYRRGYYCLVFEDPDRVMVEIVWHDQHYFSIEPA